MERTMIGVFDSEEEARAVKQELASAGIEGDRIHVRAGSTDDVAGARTGAEAGEEEHREDHRGFWARLFGFDDDADEHAGQYGEAVRRGSCLVVVDSIDADRVDEASDIMSRHGAIDIDARAASWRERGWTGYDPSAPQLSEQELAHERTLWTSNAPRTEARTDEGTTRIPVVEEELKVGKRVVERGGVRIFARTTERPVEEDVTLREERARVERRPVDRPATEAEQAQAFKDATIEVRETVEEPVVSKSARVVEEVEVGKEQSQRTEKVKDKVRRTDVQVENAAEHMQMAAQGSTAGGRQLQAGAPGAQSGSQQMQSGATAMQSGAADSRTVASRPAAGMAGSTADFDDDDLNGLLRGELSAIETYRQALDKNRDQYGQDARFGQLEQMMRDHEQAASQLRTLIRQAGGSETRDSGAWGTWANTVMGTARLFGDKAALKALKEGEESGIDDYRECIDGGVPQEMKNALMSIVSKAQQHVSELDRLIDAA
ncbi:MAG TPA: DUF2382 domain-containing protein [Casimicrobiaceae bacterium]|jgi:stress response protein YsnF